MPVYLNVYDVTAFNGYAYWFGLGVFHSGVQVHGVEYAYGAHDYPATGIFDAEPRLCPGFVFRKSILIGWTDLGPQEVQDLIDEFSESYAGNTYNLISKNCNHFCNEVCHRLTGNTIPRWVNRLANLGFLCKCVLPVQVTAVRSRANADTRSRDGDRRRLRSGSTRYGVERNDGGKSLSVISGRRSGSRRAGEKCRPTSSVTAN